MIHFPLLCTCRGRSPTVPRNRSKDPFLRSCQGLFLCVLLAIALLSASPAAHAQVNLQMDSGGTDMSKLEVGQTATINVILSGLQPGAELDTLAGTVMFNGSALGTPAITGGPILPDPLHEPTNFLTLAIPGYAEASFLTFGEESAHRIRENGVFYSFDVTATEPGRGTLGFDFVDATRPNPLDPLDPIAVDVTTGDSLEFAVVPEPASGLMLAALGLLWAGRRTRRRQS